MKKKKADINKAVNIVLSSEKVGEEQTAKKDSLISI